MLNAVNMKGCCNFYSAKFLTDWKKCAFQKLSSQKAVGVPGWQTGTRALYLYSQSPQACKSVCRAPTWLTTALMEWTSECTAHHPGSGVVPGIMSITMPLLSIKDLAVAIHQSGACWGDLPLCK